MVWVYLIVIFVILCITAAMYSNAQDKRKQRLGIPESSVLLKYSGGLNGIRSGLVYVWGAEDRLFIVSEKGGRKEIEFSNIEGINLETDVQHVNTGGGRSVGGAIVGAAIAGPVGAIVGGRKKTKLETFDNSTVKMTVKTERGQSATVIFDGGLKTYNILANITGLAI